VATSRVAAHAPASAFAVRAFSAPVSTAAHTLASASGIAAVTCATGAAAHSHAAAFSATVAPSERRAVWFRSSVVVSFLAVSLRFVFTIRWSTTMLLVIVASLVVVVVTVSAVAFRVVHVAILSGPAVSLIVVRWSVLPWLIRFVSRLLALVFKAIESLTLEASATFAGIPASTAFVATIDYWLVVFEAFVVIDKMLLRLIHMWLGVVVFPVATAWSVKIILVSVTSTFEVVSMTATPGAEVLFDICATPGAEVLFDICAASACASFYDIHRRFFLVRFVT